MFLKRRKSELRGENGRGSNCKTKEKVSEGKAEYRADPWRIRGRYRLRRCLQGVNEEKLQRFHRSESHNLAGGRRGCNKESHRSSDWSSDSGRPFVRRGGRDRSGNDPKVAGLVFIAAFAPDVGESIQSLIQNPPRGAPVPPILPPQRWLSPSRSVEVCSLVRGGCES